MVCHHQTEREGDLTSHQLAAILVAVFAICARAFP